MHYINNKSLDPKMFLVLFQKVSVLPQLQNVTIYHKKCSMYCSMYQQKVLIVLKKFPVFLGLFINLTTKTVPKGSHEFRPCQLLSCTFFSHRKESLFPRSYFHQGHEEALCFSESLERIVPCLSYNPLLSASTPWLFQSILFA